VIRLQAIARAAQEVVASPGSEGARNLLHRRLLDAGITPEVVVATPRQSLADSAIDGLRTATRRQESEAPVPRMVNKPWGHEIWWAVTEKYAGKILHVERGHRLSLQYHRDKDESCYLLSGRIVLTQGSSVDALERRTLEPGSSWRNRPGEIHTIEALEHSDVLEASTPQLDDVVRLHDHYGRISAAP
jgi:quercetin dioxygenase-like cupin family protein